jgi:hypothetical protein
VALELRLAQNACGQAAPGSAAAAWADTQPAEWLLDEAAAEFADTSVENPAQTHAENTPLPPESDSGSPGAPGFRGTISDSPHSAAPDFRRSLPSS